MDISIEEVLLALKNDEFYVEYMPIVSLHLGTCVAAEALIRWRRNGVDISPIHFIPKFEESPLIGLVTYWLIERVSADLGDWLRSHPDFHISLNVPPELFGRGGLQYAATKAKVTDLYPQFVLELTERGSPDKISLEGIRFARRLGLEIAIDDVDSGNLNLLLLARTKIDYVKIDKSIIDSIDDDGLVGPIKKEIEQLVALGHPTIVAEGIENPFQVKYLKEIGVQLGQGWLFSKALPVEKFLDFLPNCCKELAT